MEKKSKHHISNSVINNAEFSNNVQPSNHLFKIKKSNYWTHDKSRNFDNTSYNDWTHEKTMKNLHDTYYDWTHEKTMKEQNDTYYDWTHERKMNNWIDEQYIYGKLCNNWQHGHHYNNNILTHERKIKERHDWISENYIYGKSRNNHNIWLHDKEKIHKYFSDNQILMEKINNNLPSIDESSKSHIINDLTNIDESSKSHIINDLTNIDESSKSHIIDDGGSPKKHIINDLTNIDESSKNHVVNNNNHLANINVESLKSHIINDNHLSNIFFDKFSKNINDYSVNMHRYENSPKKDINNQTLKYININIDILIRKKNNEKIAINHDDAEDYNNIKKNFFALNSSNSHDDYFVKTYNRNSVFGYSCTALNVLFEEYYNHIKNGQYDNINILNNFISDYKYYKSFEFVNRKNISYIGKKSIRIIIKQLIIMINACLINIGDMNLFIFINGYFQHLNGSIKNAKKFYDKVIECSEKIYVEQSVLEKFNIAFDVVRHDKLLFKIGTIFETITYLDDKKIISEEKNIPTKSNHDRFIPGIEYSEEESKDDLEIIIDLNFKDLYLNKNIIHLDIYLDSINSTEILDKSHFYKINNY